MTKIMKTRLLTTLFTLLLANFQSTYVMAQKPNLIFILADDLGW